MHVAEQRTGIPRISSSRWLTVSFPRKVFLPTDGRPEPTWPSPSRELLDPDLRAHPRMDAALHPSDSVGVSNSGQCGAGDERFPAAGDEVEPGYVQTFRRRDWVAGEVIQQRNEAAAEVLDGGERVRLATNVLDEQGLARVSGCLKWIEVPVCEPCVSLLVRR